MNGFSRWSLIVLLATGMAGCGSSPAPVAQVHLGPHQTALVGLPDRAGFAEVVNEPEVTDRRGNPNTAIVVYFLQPDEKSALGAAPTDVRIVLDRGRKKTETLPLKNEPKSEDAAGGCRFVSKTGPYLLENNRARLTGKLDGKPFELDLSGGR